MTDWCSFEHDGVRFDFVDGRKGPTDLKLLVTMPSRYPIRMSTGLIINNFLFDNEEKIYPPPRFAGGAYWKWAAIDAMYSGWRIVDERLKRDQERKRAGEK